MKKHFIVDGRLTTLGVACSVGCGLFLVYMSVEFIPWKLGKFIGLCIGIATAAIGGFSGRAHALNLPPPFTNDPLGWRKAKRTYKASDRAEELNGSSKKR